MNQFQNRGWDLAGPNGTIETWERVQVAVLMDIRRELQRLNTLLHCHNFLGMPATMQQIAANTRKPKKKRPAKKARG